MLFAFVLACSPCKRGKACSVADGEFYAVEPASWDGSSELPMVMIFHGWTGSPHQYSEDEEAVATFEDFGWLMVLPQGIDATWQIDHMGLAGSGRNELEFVDSVMARVGEIWPIDESRRYVAGFSLGASLAYTVACERSDVFAAAAPMSGGFWLPVPKTCDGPEIPICHIHGLADETWPYEGRTVTQDEEEGVQAHVEDDVAFWREHNDCQPETSVYEVENLTCTYWSDCDGGSEVGLCTHDGGHDRIAGWTERELEWMQLFTR